MTAGRNINTKSKEWCTPKKYVDAVREVFGGNIQLDPCSNKYSIVHAEIEYSLPEKNGLRETWDYQTIYVNPPYGRDKKTGVSIKDWLERCAKAHKDYGSEVIALVPVATNTGHWKESVYGKAKAICFLFDTRLKFLENGKGGGKGAPMSCAMIYWGENYDNFYNIFIHYGAVVNLSNLMDEKRVGKTSKILNTYL
ncbi:MAG TPA: DNA N-6-adenine-methyltransferase [Candidatus Nanoarchaeia archaeon]|nr:DNA N-6-adenine-methyltransferase [Candidatus Nanoarchaeia archaeon]